jgi:hypothetical protein
MHSAKTAQQWLDQIQRAHGHAAAGDENVDTTQGVQHDLFQLLLNT